MLSFREITGSILVCLMLVTLVSPVFASDQVEKETFTLEEIQELVLANSRNLEKIDLITDQVQSAKYIYNNEYDRIRSNKIGNNMISGSKIDEVESKMQLINDQVVGYNLFSDEELEQAYLNPEMSAYKPVLNQFSLLKMQAGLYQQTNTMTNEIVEGQMELLNGLGVADYSSLLKEIRDKRDDAKDQLKDLERTKDETQEQIKQIVNLLVFQTTKLEKNVELLDKAYQQYLKMTHVERLKQSVGLANEVNVKDVAIQASNYQKQYNYAQANLKILKGQISDMMGRNVDDALEIVDFAVPETPVPAPGYESIIDEVLENSYQFTIYERDIENLEDDVDDLDGSNKKNIKKKEVEKVKLDVKDKEVEIRTDIKSLLAEYNEKLKTYQLAIVNYQKASKQYEWKQLEYNSQIISKLMLTGAELEYIQAFNAKISAGYDYYLVKEELEDARQGIFMLDSYNTTKARFASSSK